MCLIQPVYEDVELIDKNDDFIKNVNTKYDKPWNKIKGCVSFKQYRKKVLHWIVNTMHHNVGIKPYKVS